MAELSTQSAASALGGTELVPVDQSGFKKATAAQFKTFAQTGLGTAAFVNMSVGTSAPGSPSVGDLWIDTN